MNTTLRFGFFTIITLLLVGCGSGSSTSDDNQTVPDTNTIKTVKITSPSNKNVIEGSTEILTVTTEDSNVTFSIVAGADADKFTLDAKSGILSFKNAPDFENPTDSDANNTYIVEVEATHPYNEKATQTIIVTVLNNESDDGPTFTSNSSISLQENKLLDFTVSATDAVKFQIEGEDEKRFSINETTGKLDFINFIPDFEHPSDANRDNRYVINIIASDDENYTATQSFSIEITNDTQDDASEQNKITIYKTGADDGILENDGFGEDRNFTTETIGGEKVVYVGERVWQDDADNKVANYDYFEAQDYCNNLNYAGFNDWRVPNRHESYEIVNYSQSHTTTPTIDNIFENSAKGNYWTSEEVIGHAGNVLTNMAFVVSFTDGASYPLDRGGKYSIRCVRGERLSYTEYISKDSDDIYRDPKTGFMWTAPAGPESMISAKQRCENLKFGNYEDWRLPNINELHTIMPTVVPGSNHPYGAEPLLVNGAHQLWSSTKLNEIDGRYIDNYWYFGVWGDDDTVPVDADHPLGRDVMNDAVLPIENAVSVFSICIRGGHL